MTEVQEPRPQGRRRFSEAQKRHIWLAADACALGEQSALLRREGVYSSQLTTWRRRFAQSGSAGLATQRPGQSAKQDEEDREILAPERKVKILEKQLGIANSLVELRTNVQALLAQIHQDDPKGAS